MLFSASVDELIRVRTCPNARSWSKQTWQNLLFAHAPLDPRSLRGALPEPLELDTFDGHAWIGLVAFAMTGLSFRGVPHPSFLETNVRTYVRHPDHGPGVWFFSLDASQYLPCLAARSWFKLPYCHSRMSMEVGELISASGQRNSKQRLPRVFEKPSDQFAYQLAFIPGSDPAPAKQLTFDFWALERYQLFSADSDGRVLKGQVWHEPYVVSEATMNELDFRSGDKRFHDLKFRHFRHSGGVSVRAYKPEHV
ncbi:MAG TPA: DUF2071 domain-containing protein [Fimbriimonadaceae bacterium]|nr:DUF2071 domain-containing protein [Fimbriimonadaceae bacterium]